VREADRDLDLRLRQAEGRPDCRGDSRRSSPQPYKGKGIKYEGEKILRKEGKKK